MYRVFYLAVMSFGFMVLGCSGVQYVDSAESREYSSLGIDYHDLEKAASDNVKSLLESAYVLSLSKLSKPKVLAISDVLNDTMQHFSTEELTRKVIRDMRNSGKFILTMAFAGNGGSRDKMLDSVRKSREDDEVDQYSVPEKGNIIAPDLSLSGKIVQRNTRIKSKQRVDYFFLLTLTDVKSGLVVWDNEVNIIKVGKRNTSAW